MAAIREEGNGSPNSIGTPSTFHLALALAISKSKPEGLSIRDYILQIRKHLSVIPPTDDAGQARYTIDVAAYWKEQYERVQADAFGLRDTVAHLERERGTLEQRVQAMTDASSNVNQSKKRKRDTTKESTAPDAVKRTRRGEAVASVEAGLQPHDPFLQDTNILGNGGGHGARIAQSLHRLQKLYRQADPDTAELSHHLMGVSTELAAITSSLSNPSSSDPSSSQSSTIPHFGATFRAAARVYTVLLHGLGKLSGHDGNHRHKGAVIYVYVQSFSQLLDCITDTSLARAKRDMALGQIEDAAQASKVKTKGKASKTPKEQDVPGMFVALAKAVLSHLDPSESTHRELFEGFAFIVLESIGKRLHVFTFGTERRATIEGDMHPPEESEAASVEPPNEAEAKSIRIEAPYLLSIFERVMAIAPQYLGPQPAQTSRGAKSSASTSKPSVKFAGSCARSTLSLHAKERLQQTLVNSIFGDDGKDEFIDCLRMPMRIGPPPPPSKVEEEDVAVWFRQEVWRLLGWDILGREGDW